MKAIYIVLIAVAALSGFLIGYIKWEFFEKKRNKSEIHELQCRLDAKSVQSDELIATKITLHKLKEKRTKLESVLTALLEASTHGILTVDAQMHIRHFNKKFCNIWDLAEVEIHAGAKVYDVLKVCMGKTIEPEMFLLNHHKINFSRDVIWSAEIHLLNGKIFHSSSSPIREANGTYYGRIWEFFDVTERVRRERSLYEAYSTIGKQYKKLTETEETLRHQFSLLKETESYLEEENNFISGLLETATHGIVSTDSHWRIRHYNKRFCEMWELSEDIVYAGANGHEILRHCMKQTINPDQFIHDGMLIIKSQDIFWDNRIYLLSGKIFKSFSSPIYAFDGTYYGRIWKVIDITDDVLQEQNLLQQQKLERAYADTILKGNQLALVFEGTGGGMWTWNTSTDLFTLNPKFASQYRSLSESQPLDSFISAIHPTDQEKCTKSFREITRNDHICFEFQLQTHPGMWSGVLLRGIVYDVDDNDCPLILAGIIIDITERKQYENHLQPADPARKTMSTA